MGNEMADAIREELRDALIRAHGTLDAAAAALGIPYKTLYRALTTRGKDRSQSVKLDLVVDIAEHVAMPFSTVYARAQERVAEDRTRNGIAGAEAAGNVVHGRFGNVPARGEDDLLAAASESENTREDDRTDEGFD